jgi:cyanophycin synthetase
MKIIEIKVLRGPNYWSVRRDKLIQMVLDLEELENSPTNKIDGFKNRLETMFPTMIEHRCSVGEKGGFFSRVEEGTWMGHVIEHIALELQTLAGMETGFGRTRGTGKDGEYYVVFNYTEEESGVFAAKSAVAIAHALIENTEYDVSADIMTLREIREKTRLGPSTVCIVDEAAKRGIPFIRFYKQSLVQLGYGVNQKRIRATIASTTSNIAVDIAGNKSETKNLLGAAEIPVPKGDVVRTEEELKKAIDLAIKNIGKKNLKPVVPYTVVLKKGPEKPIPASKQPKGAAIKTPVKEILKKVVKKSLTKNVEKVKVAVAKKVTVIVKAPVKIVKKEIVKTVVKSKAKSVVKATSKIKRKTK